MKRIILFILALAIIAPVFGQRNKKEEGEIVVPTFIEGVTYALPRTGIRLHVKAVKETFEPGPYAVYAEQLLGITNAKTKSSVKWAFDDVKIGTFSEPDPNQVYKAMGNVSFLVSLAPNGCLAGINSGSSVSETKMVQTNSFVTEPEYDKGFSFANFNDSPMLSPGDSTNNFRPVRINADQKAAEAARKIFESRTTRFDIVAGLLDEFHPDGKAYEESLNELKRIENNYLSLFTGRTTYKNEVFSFDYVPGASAEKGDIVFRFSDENGVVPASDLSGKPVMLKIETEKDLVGKYNGLAKSDNPTAGESGVYYRMPGIGTINIIYELKSIATARTTLSQFGVVAPVPEELLFGDYKLEFHPETGAIKSVSKK